MKTPPNTANRKLNSTKTLLAIALAACLPLAAIAQSTRPAQNEDKDEGEKIVLSPFIVSDKSDVGYSSRETTAGSRYAKDLLEIPSSVVVMNREFIADINPQSALDLVSVGVSGVTPVRADIDQFNFRGFAISFMLRDGNMQRGYKRSPLYDIDRVEVIKGPSALSFGNNQFIGGVLNYIPRAPAAKKEGGLKVTVSEYNYYRLEAHTGSPLFESDDFAVRYRVNVGMEKGDHERADTHDDNRFVSAAVGFYFGPNTSLRLNASHFIDEGYRPIGNFLDRTSTVYARLHPLSTPKGVTPFAPNHPNVYQDHFDSQFNVKFLHKLTDNSNMSIFAAYGNNLADYALSRFTLLEPDNFTLRRVYASDMIRTRVWNVTADYLHKFERDGWTNEFSAGADFNALSDYRHGFSQSNITGFNPVPKIDARNPNYGPDEIFFRNLFALFPNFKPSERRYGRQGAFTGIPGAYERDQDASNYSYYLQNSLKFWQDKLTVVSGLRWLTTSSGSRQVLTNTYFPVADRKFNAYKHGLVYAPTRDISFYATAAANRIPPVNVIDAFGNIIPDRDAELKEAGIKINRDLTDRFSLTGQIVYFDMDQTNAATNVLDSGGTVIGVAYSAGDTSKGWEVDLNARMKFPNGNADVIVTFTTIRSRGVNGLSFLNLPPEKYSMVVRYSWTGGPLQNLTIGANMFDTTEQRRSPYLIDEKPIYNAFASYRFRKNWQVQLNLNNITDERYVMGLFNNAAAWTPTAFRPRLSVNYNW